MHIGLVGVPARRGDMLDFIVVGGGIAGLATAWSLQEVGHRVTVLEQNHAEVLSKCREGVRSPPAMTKIFNDWGIGDQLSRMSTPVLQIACLDAKTGEELGFVPMNDKAMEEALPANFNSVVYGELFTLFYELAKSAGVDLQFNSKVVSVDLWEGMVSCEDGPQLTAGVIAVGADGTESIVRPVIIGSSAPPLDDNQCSVCLVTPTDVARQDEELAALLDGNTVREEFPLSLESLRAEVGSKYIFNRFLDMDGRGEDDCGNDDHDHDHDQDGLVSVSVVVDTEVERDSPTYQIPIFFHPIISEDEDVVEAEAHRRGLRVSVSHRPPHFLRLDSWS